MNRFHQLVFVSATLGLSWFLMMAIHEFGHVIGALISGGSVQRIVLHPLTISRTDVSPNPYPGLVVWLGPLFGTILPLLILFFLPKGDRQKTLKQVCLFFAGFALIANGAYIGIGAFERIGDCVEMLRTGSPLWILVLFGATSTIGGFIIWHRLGSPRSFIQSPGKPDIKLTYSLLIALIVIVSAELLLSPT